ncbi:MAG: bacterial transcriptional activator domain-containing protein, partial [Candidatus Dormibacteraeota bacterium]|nr:bacterial transcriptional activator domain-containing protein [Candidatus Dormibacteraeota bacterium]
AGGSGLRPSVAPTGHSGGGEASQSTHADWTVTLARDGLIGGGLAAGLAVLLLAAQRYERWRRRPSDQARSRVALLARRPNMLRIRGALAAAVGSDHADPDGDAPALGGADLQGVLMAVKSVPGRILVGQRRVGGAEVVADIDQLHGLVISGSGGDAVGRALLLSFLVHHPWEMAQAVIGGPTSNRLLPGAECVPGLQLHPEIDAFLTQLEGEVGYQRSILDREHLDDWRELGSDDPLPALMALVRAEDLSPAHLDRLGAVVSDAKGCAIAVIVLGSFADLGWGRHLAVDAGGLVDPASADLVSGASVLYHLDEQEAEELLAVVGAGRGPDIVPEITEDEEEATAGPAAEPKEVLQPHDATSAPAISPLLEVRPVDVRIFGRVRVLVNGREVETGLPASGRQVLALLVVRGELTEAQGVDAFSAGNSSDYYANQWAAGTRKTRAALRDLLGDRTVNCLTCVGGLFRLNDEMVSSDYGRLLAGRRAARETADAEARRALLATATRDLRGEPFANAAYNWLIEDEAAVRSRAMTALEELARLHADAGDLDAAVMALDQALSLDPDPVEAVFQQMMLFQHRLGHGEAVRDLYGRLRHQLVLRCDREPSAETEFLMESLGSAARLVAG